MNSGNVSTPQVPNAGTGYSNTNTNAGTGYSNTNTNVPPANVGLEGGAKRRAGTRKPVKKTEKKPVKKTEKTTTRKVSKRDESKSGKSKRDDGKQSNSKQSKKGGSFVADVQNLAVPFAILLAKEGLSKVFKKDAKPSASAKSASRPSSLRRKSTLSGGSCNLGCGAMTGGRAARELFQLQKEIDNFLEKY
jgi:hypothetical protein